MPVQFRHKIDQNVLQQTQNAFFGKAFAYDFNFSSFNKNTQNIEGLVVGGNLANLYSLLGTDLDIDTQGKILFIEDIGEHLYNIDRMMIALKKARKLEGLKALIVGDFTDITKNTPYFGKNYQEIILEHSADYDFPVIFDAPIGHIANNYPLLLGEKLQILIEQNKKVRFLQLQDKLNEL
jgi:muramoyltetrapeptide carboxypeptidase